MYQRFGILMVLTGAVLFLSTLSESEQQLPYSIGRVGGFFPVWLFTYLHLAFPAGRLGTRADRLLTWTAAALLVALFIAPLPVGEAFPDPSPFSSCDRDCPHNAFFVAGGEPPLLEGFMRPLRETLTILLICAVVVRLAQRSATATPLMCRTLFPALVASAVWLVAVTAMNVIRLARCWHATTGSRCTGVWARAPCATARTIELWDPAMGRTRTDDELRPKVGFGLARAGCSRRFRRVVMRGQPVLDGRAVARRLSGSLRLHGAGAAPAARFERRVRDAFRLLEQRPGLARALPRPRSPRHPTGSDGARRTIRMDRPAIPGA